MILPHGKGIMSDVSAPISTEDALCTVAMLLWVSVITLNDNRHPSFLQSKTNDNSSWEWEGMRKTLHIHLFLYLHKLTFAATHEKRLPSAFKMSQCISEREKERLLLCQQVQVAKTIARWSNGIYEKHKWHFCLPFRSGKHIFTGRSNTRMLRERIHGARMASVWGKVSFLTHLFIKKHLTQRKNLRKDERCT